MSEVQSPRSRRRARRRLLGVVVMVVPLLFVAVRTFGPVPLRIRSAAMTPFLAVNDYVWTWPVRSAPPPGAVVIVRPPEWRAEDRWLRWRARWNRTAAAWFNRPIEAAAVGPEYVVRLVVAEAGDSVRILPTAVEVRTASGTTRRIGVEEMVDGALALAQRELVVPAEHLFVLALRRGHSDSRHWGTIPAAATGRIVWARLWPFGGFGLLDGAVLIRTP